MISIYMALIINPLDFFNMKKIYIIFLFFCFNITFSQNVISITSVPNNSTNCSSVAPNSRGYVYNVMFDEIPCLTTVNYKLKIEGPGLNTQYAGNGISQGSFTSGGCFEPGWIWFNSIEQITVPYGYINFGLPFTVQIIEINGLDISLDSPIISDIKNQPPLNTNSASTEFWDTNGVNIGLQTRGDLHTPYPGYSRCSINDPIRLYIADVILNPCSIYSLTPNTNLPSYTSTTYNNNYRGCVGLIPFNRVKLEIELSGANSGTYIIDMPNQHTDQNTNYNLLAGHSRSSNNLNLNWFVNPGNTLIKIKKVFNSCFSSYKIPLTPFGDEFIFYFNRYRLDVPQYNTTNTYFQSPTMGCVNNNLNVNLISNININNVMDLPLDFGLSDSLNYIFFYTITGTGGSTYNYSSNTTTYSVNTSNITYNPPNSIFTNTFNIVIPSSAFPSSGNYTLTITKISSSSCTLDTPDITTIVSINDIISLSGAELISVADGCLNNSISGQISNLTLANGTYEVNYAINGNINSNNNISSLVVTNGIGVFTIPGSAITSIGQSNLVINTISYANGSCAVTPPNPLADTFLVADLPNSSGTNSVTILDICIGFGATVNFSSTSLANGTYNLVYTLSGVNSGTFTATNVVFASGTGTFTIPSSALANSGTTNITLNTISNIASSCQSSF
jgi:hypothetical protein